MITEANQSQVAVRKLKTQGSQGSDSVSVQGWRVRSRGRGGGRRAGRHWCKSQCPEAWEPGALMSGERKEWMSQFNKRGNLLFCYLFLPFRSSVDWIMPSHIGEGGLSLPSLLIQILIFSGNTTEIPRNNILPAIWTSLNPVKLTYKINYLSYLEWQWSEGMNILRKSEESTREELC